MEFSGYGHRKEIAASDGSSNLFLRNIQTDFTMDAINVHPHQHSIKALLSTPILSNICCNMLMIAILTVGKYYLKVLICISLTAKDIRYLLKQHWSLVFLFNGNSIISFAHL